jgi:hypothetical protein
VFCQSKALAAGLPPEIASRKLQVFRNEKACCLYLREAGDDRYPSKTEMPSPFDFVRPKVDFRSAAWAAGSPKAIATGTKRDRTTRAFEASPIANRLELQGTRGACRSILGRSLWKASMIRIACPFTGLSICNTSIANATPDSAPTA